MKTPTPLLALALCVGALPTFAASLPYTNDFSGAGANVAFTTETPDAEWAVLNGAYRNTYTNSSFTPSSASLSLSGVAGNNFTIETRFTVQQLGTFNANTATLGFGFLASSSSFSDSANSYYLADFAFGNNSSSNVGRLRILSLGDTAGFTGTNGAADDNAAVNLAITTGTTYTLRLEGSFVGSTLNLTLALFNADGTTQIGTTATASDTSPLSGEFFGYRNRIGIGGGTSIIDFDNYNVSAIPEPASFASLGGVAVFGLALLQRRKRGKRG